MSSLCECKECVMVECEGRMVLKSFHFRVEGGSGTC